MSFLLNILVGRQDWFGLRSGAISLARLHDALAIAARDEAFAYSGDAFHKLSVSLSLTGRFGAVSM